MKKEYILFIDSGVGGLSTLCETYRVLPANFIYFADNKHSPYGNHSEDKIYKFLEDIVVSVSKTYSLIMVVLACNTATTSSIKRLRDKFKTIKFIGTEPAIKLGFKNNYKRILTIATPATIRQKKYKHLVNSLNANVKNLALKNFASNIENYFVHRSFCAYFNVLKNIYKIATSSRSSDCLILGCTHYVLFKNKIIQISKKPAFDGNLGVSKQVLFWHEILSETKQIKPTIKFLSSDNKSCPKEIYKKIFYEILANL